MTPLTFDTSDTLQELVLTFTAGSPTLKRQAAFARAQAATCETDGHRVRVIVLLRDLLRDIQAEEAQALRALPLPSTVLPTTHTAPPSVLGKRSRDPIRDNEREETTFQVVKRARPIAKREASEVVVELTSPAALASEAVARKPTRRSTRKAALDIPPSSEATSSLASTSTAITKTKRTSQPLTVLRQGRPAWDQHTRDVIHNAWSTSSKGSNEVRRGVNVSLALHPSLKLEHAEDYNPYVGDRNSVEPDADALSEDEDVVKRRELLELEEAVMLLKARQGRRV